MNFLHSVVNRSRSLGNAYVCALILAGCALSAQGVWAQALPVTTHGALQTVRGAAALLSVARDGSVWVVDPEGALYARAQNSSTWSRRGSGVAAVAAVDQNSAWSLSVSGELVALSGGSRRVYAAPDSVDLAVGVDGSIVLATDTGALLVSRDEQWANGQFPYGLARKVALDEHALPWVINEAAVLYRFDGTQWQIVANGVRHVSIGASGVVMLTDLSGRTLSWDAAAQRWSLLPALSALTLLATNIAPDGALWSVLANGEIALLPSNTATANGSDARDTNLRPPATFTRLLQWKIMRGLGRSLSVSPSGSVIALDEQGTAHRYQGRGQWSIYPGRFTAIAGAADQSLWALKEGGLLMRSVRGVWSDIAAMPLASIAPEARGSGLWALTPDGSVMRLLAPAFSAQRIVSPRARQLSVDAANAVWLLDTNGELWRSKSISGSSVDWARVSFGGLKAKSIAGGARQSAYAVAASDEIYWFDPRENLFKPANGRAASVALGPRDALWAMTANGDILASAAALAVDGVGTEPATAPTPDLSRPATVNFALRAETTRKPLQFRTIDGLAGDVTVSAFGAVFATGKETGVSCFSPALQKFLPLISGAARRVSASPDRDVWIVDALGQLTWLKYAVAASATSPLALPVTDVSVATDGSVFVVGRDEQVLRRTSANDAFEPVELRANGFTINAYRIAAVSRNMLWIANKSGGLWRCNNGQCIAQTMSAKDISVGPEGSVFVVDAAGNLQRQIAVSSTTASNAVASFERIGQGNIANAATGPQGLPWLVTATGTVLTAEPLPKPTTGNLGGHDFCQNLTSTAAVSVTALPALPVSLPIISIIARPDAATLARGGVLDLLSNDSYGAARADASMSGNVRFQLLSTDLPSNAIASTGMVTIPAMQNPGSYRVRYGICAAPQGQPCASSSVAIRVTAPTFLATLVDDTVTLARGGSFNLLANDSIDSRPVELGVNAAFSVISSSLPSAAVRDGVVTISADQAAGMYAIRYQLCGLLAGQSCAMASANITVSPPAFVATATDDRVSLLRGASFDLLANDRVAGAPAIVGGNARFVLVSSTLPSRFINAGVLTISSDQALGAYSLRYQLCGLLAGQSCVEASALITVIVPPFIAVVGADDFTLPPGASRDLLANDSVNNEPVALDVNARFELLSSALPAGSVDRFGVVTVPTNVSPGVFNLRYQLCGLLRDQACVATNATITVTAAPFVAQVNPDNVTLAQSQSVNLIANDSVGGGPVALGINASFSVIATTLPRSSIASDGVVTAPANQGPGYYSINYQLCGLLSGQGCVAAISTITVTPITPPFFASVNPDNATLQPGQSVDLLLNDSVGGRPVNLGSNALFSVLSSTLRSGSISPTGVVSISAAQPLGVYTVTYRLCGVLAAQGCFSTVSTITVAIPTPAFVAVANPDNVTLEQTRTINLLANDTVAGGGVVVGTNASFNLLNSTLPPVSISVAGVVTIALGQAPGAYTVNYQLCGLQQGQGCVGTSSSITVVPLFVAVVNADNFATETPASVLPLISNDTVAGGAVNLGVNANFVELSSTLPTGTYSSGGGAVQISSSIAPGSYSLTYRLCGVIAGQGCSLNAVASFNVVTPFVAILSGEAASLRPFETLDVLANDTVSGGPVNVGGNATLTVLSSGAIPASAISASGVLTIPAAQPPSAGNTITYRLCGLIAGQSCRQASAVIAVLAPWVGTAVNDFVFGVAAGATVNPLANDTSNGVAAVVGVNVLFERRPYNGQFPPLPANAVSATGVVTMPQSASGTQFGMAYRICGRFAGQGCSADADVAVIGQ